MKEKAPVRKQGPKVTEHKALDSGLFSIIPMQCSILETKGALLITLTYLAYLEAFMIILNFDCYLVT